MKFYVVSSTNT